MLNHKGTRDIHTERLHLRKYRIEDAHDMFQNYACDARVTKFMSWEPYRDEKEVLAFIKSILPTYEQETTYNWVIEYEGEMIGSISALYVNECHNNCEVGYCLGYDFWNKGIMSEALSAVITYLFQEVGLHRIIAKHDAENPASGEVMKKCGMTYEGSLKEHYFRKDGTYSDSIVYGIVNQ